MTTTYYATKVTKAHVDFWTEFLARPHISLVSGRPAPKIGDYILHVAEQHDELTPILGTRIRTKHYATISAKDLDQYFTTELLNRYTGEGPCYYAFIK